MEPAYENGGTGAEWEHGDDQDQMLVNEEIEEMQEDLQHEDIQTYFVPEKSGGLPSQITSSFSSGIARNIPVSHVNIFDA